MNAAGDKYIDLVKASDAFRQLKRDAESNLSHAYLLLSADRLGLDILADLFVAEACGARDAYRRIAAGTLADVITLPETGEKVTVRDVDYLTETAFITPTELERKFYIVDYGETMNEPSQNKLLKTLEEPPSVAVIVIKSASESAMLPTVRSRCRRVELKPFASAALGARLGQLYGGSPRLPVALAANRGMLSEAERLISGDKYAEMYELAVDMLKNMRRSPDAARYAGQILKYKDNLGDILEYTELILRDCLAVAAARPHLALNVAGVQDAREIASAYPPEAVVRIMPCFTRARARLKTNGNAAGVVDELLFSMLEVKAKWK